MKYRRKNFGIIYIFILLFGLFACFYELVVTEDYRLFFKHSLDANTIIVRGMGSTSWGSHIVINGYDYLCEAIPEIRDNSYLDSRVPNAIELTGIPLPNIPIPDAEYPRILVRGKLISAAPVFEVEEAYQVVTLVSYLISHHNLLLMLLGLGLLFLYMWVIPIVAIVKLILWISRCKNKSQVRKQKNDYEK